eukprot:3879256-Alexandrium_andersonii.AAC.1
MSASLVGSEMCIRDRQCRSIRGPARQKTRTNSSFPQRFRRNNRACTAAVSYTHLTLPTICSV